jgi:lipoprotein-anchoring transpeptidase ErfK/SrfK
VTSRRLRRTLTAILLVAAGSVPGAVPGVAAEAVSLAVAPTQRLAALRAARGAFTQPSPSATRLMVVAARRPLTGERTTLPVLGERTIADGSRWLRVRLPGRPNGRVGWIRASGTLASTTSWHLVVDISSRRLTVYEHGRPVRTVKAVVGRPRTPTPYGTFFVEETIRLRASDAGAPYALALSARSTVYQEFAGGPGQIALHGRAHIGGTLGTAVSHGCVRLDVATLRWLVLRIAPGVPVTVTA